MKRPYDDLVREVARIEDLPIAQVRRALERFFAILPEVVWGHGRLAVPGFAVFRVRSRKARRIMNPATREPMKLPAARAVVVRAVGSWRRRG